MNRPASKASPTPRPMSAPHPGGGNGKEPPPAPHSGGGNGKGPIDPRRLKFKEIAGKRTAAVLHTLEVLTQLAENAHRSHYIAYEQDLWRSKQPYRARSTSAWRPSGEVSASLRSISAPIRGREAAPVVPRLVRS